MKSIKTLLMALLPMILGTFMMESCSKWETPSDEGYVQLTLNQPELEIITKAEAVSDDYNVVISQSGIEKKNDTYGNLKTRFPLSTGNYQIYAQNIDEEAALTAREGRGEQRFYGESTFVVSAGVLTPVSFTCQMVNSRVSVVLDDSFKAVFKEAQVSINESSDADRKIIFPYTSTIEDSALWGYFNIDNDPEVIVNVAVVRNDGQENNFTVNVSIEPKTWHKFTIKSNSTSGEADVDIYVDNTLVEKDHEWGVDPY